MKPVNLLPEKDRPYVPSGKHQGSAYAVVGLLGVLLLLLGAYVLTANRVTDRRAEAELAKQEATEAETKSAKLGGFTSFAEMRETRETSVTDLAQERFDWERLSRELARVLPRGVFATEISAAVDPEDAAAGGEAGGAPATGAAGAGGSAGPEDEGPQLKLTGCAPTQPDVATAMVRLRSLHRAREVTLEDSSREPNAGAGDASAAAGPPAATTEGSSAEAGGCEDARGRPIYKFAATVSFDSPREDRSDAGRAPAALGGGS